MKRFLFEEKEYRISASFRKRRAGEDSAHALARVLRRAAGRKSHGSASGGGGRKAVDLRQKCVVKAQYSKSIEAHRVQLDYYLTREGTERDGSRAELYGTDIEEYRENMVGKNFRIFLSPQSDRINLKDLACRVIKRIELETGYKLFWQGANHYNTAHPHAHLLINGVDKAGREVELPRDLVKTFMREAAMDFCTAQIGMRTKEDLEIERERALTSPRFTPLDNRLVEMCDGGFTVRVDKAIPERDRLLARLEYLRSIKLAEYSGGAYKMNPKWEESLRNNGRYNTYLKAREQLKFTHPSKLSVYSGAAEYVSGRVTKIYRTDEDASDNHAVLLEAADGRAYFVPLMKKPEVFEKGKGKTPLAEGDLVTIKADVNARGRLLPSIFRTNERQLLRAAKRSGLSEEKVAALIGKEKIKTDANRKI